MTPVNKLQALVQGHQNKIENSKDVIASLNVEKGYKLHLPIQNGLHFWDYYLAVGNPRNIKNRYLEVHPGLIPNRNVIDEMIAKVAWLKKRIASGDLPETNGAFIWARATGTSNLSIQQKLILAANGLSIPKSKVTV